MLRDGYNFCDFCALPVNNSDGWILDEKATNSIHKHCMLLCQNPTFLGNKIKELEAIQESKVKRSTKSEFKQRAKFFKLGMKEINDKE